MNKTHLLIGIAMIQSFVAESKDYTFLPQLNDKTSERCNGVEAARFSPRSDLEYSCDGVESILKEYAQITGRVNLFGQHIEPMLASKSSSERLELVLSNPEIYIGHPYYLLDGGSLPNLKSENVKDLFRTIHADEDVATKLEAYRSFKKLARTLNHEKREEREAAIEEAKKQKAQQKAEYKAKRAEEKLVKF